MAKTNRRRQGMKIAVCFSWPILKSITEDIFLSVVSVGNSRRCAEVGEDGISGIKSLQFSVPESRL